MNSKLPEMISGVLKRDAMQTLGVSLIFILKDWIQIVLDPSEYFAKSVVHMKHHRKKNCKTRFRLS